MWEFLQLQKHKKFYKKFEKIRQNIAIKFID